jgi:SAM-dependent methyltransferase
MIAARMLHQLARFSSVAPLIEETRPGSVLDVGSGSEGIAGWLGTEWSVTALDSSFEFIGAMSGPGRAARREFVGDARALPFASQAFDVAVALDVVEHLAPEDRSRAIAELVRVARRRVIVACPTGGAALAADGRLSGSLRARGMPAPTWLLEHELHGFPERDELSAQLAGHGAVHLIDNENLRWHEWLFRFEFRRPGFHTSRAAARLLAKGLASRRPVRWLSRIAVRAVQGPNRAPSYRTIAVLDLHDGHPA